MIVMVPFFLSYFFEKQIGLDGCEVYDIAAGNMCSYILADEGVVYSCGDGSYGRLGHGNSKSLSEFKRVEEMDEGATCIVAGDYHVAALIGEEKLYTWGFNMCGQLGHVNSPVTVPQHAKVTSIHTHYGWTDNDVLIAYCVFPGGPLGV